MKLIYLILILSINANATTISRPQGGVDVGNARIVNFRLEKEFYSEKEMIKFMESQTLNMAKGNIQYLSKKLNNHKCSKASIVNMEKIRKYPLENGKLIKKITADIQIKLLNCKGNKL